MNYKIYILIAIILIIVFTPLAVLDKEFRIGFMLGLLMGGLFVLIHSIIYLIWRDGLKPFFKNNEKCKTEKYLNSNELERRYKNG